MSLPRYAARTAVFAALYLFATIAGGWTELGNVHLIWPAAAVGALWLVAQSRYGMRNLDVIALGVAAALIPSTNTGILAALSLATTQVVPALLFAWLTERWTPGYWLGHGDRFRRLGPTVLRLAAAAAIAAVTGAALQHIVRQDTITAAETAYLLLRDTLAVLVTMLVSRTARQRPTTRRGGRKSTGGGSTGGGSHTGLSIVR